MIVHLDKLVSYIDDCYISDQSIVIETKKHGQVEVLFDANGKMYITLLAPKDWYKNCIIDVVLTCEGEAINLTVVGG